MLNVKTSHISLKEYKNVLPHTGIIDNKTHLLLAIYYNNLISMYYRYAYRIRYAIFNMCSKIDGYPG